MAWLMDRSRCLATNTLVGTPNFKEVQAREGHGPVGDDVVGEQRADEQPHPEQDDKGAKHQLISFFALADTKMPSWACTRAEMRIMGAAIQVRWSASLQTSPSTSATDGRLHVKAAVAEHGRNSQVRAAPRVTSTSELGTERSRIGRRYLAGAINQ